MNRVALDDMVAAPHVLQHLGLVHNLHSPSEGAGFTSAGMSEPPGLIATLILLVLTPRGSADFWLTLVAFLGLLGMRAVYGLWTRPVNNFWLQGEKLNAIGAGFFSWGAASRWDREVDTCLWIGHGDVIAGSIRTWRGRDWQSSALLRWLSPARQLMVRRGVPAVLEQYTTICCTCL
jgi:hypothetical protein